MNATRTCMMYVCMKAILSCALACSHSPCVRVLFGGSMRWRERIACVVLRRINNTLYGTTLMHVCMF